MACKLDVDEVVHGVVQREIKNISTINEEGFANVNMNFKKQQLSSLNKRFKEEAVKFIPGNNDLPGYIKIELSDSLYDTYIRIIDRKREEDSKNQNNGLYFKKILDLVDVKADSLFHSSDTSIEQEKSEFSDANKDILFNNITNRPLNSKEVLSNILNGLQNTEPNFKKLIEKLIEKSDAKVVFKSMPGNSFMGYRPSSRTIFIDKESFDKVDTVTMTESFVHEVVHEMLVEVLNNPKSIDDRIFASSLNNQFTKYKELFEKSKKNYSKNIAYGFTDLNEFTSELMSSPSFRKTLNDLDSENNSSFFSKIINAIKSLFGFKNSDNVGDMFDQIVNFINDFEYTRTNDSYVYQKIIETYDDIKTNKTTLDGKYEDLMDNIKASLDQNIKKFSEIAKRLNYTDEKASEKVSSYAKQLKDTQEDIEKFRYINSAAALTTFAESMDTTLNIIEKRFSEIKDKTNEESINFYSTYKTYLDTYAIAPSITELIIDLQEDNNKQETILDVDELSQVYLKLKNSVTAYADLQKRSATIQKNIIKKAYANIDYFPEIITKYTDILSKEYKQQNITQDKDSWINSKLQSPFIQEKIEEDLKETIDDLFENDQYDISQSSLFFNAALNVNSKLLSVLTRNLTNIKNERVDIEKEKDKEINDIFDELAKDRGSKNIEKLYKNLLDFDADGKAYIKGIYKTLFLDSVHKPIKEKRKAIRDLNDEYELNLAVNILPENSKEYNLRFREKNNKVTKLLKEIKTIEKNNFIYDAKGAIVKPKDKWLNDLSKLSKVEKETLNYLTTLTEENNELYRGNNNLVLYTYKTKFYELPKITKPSAERFLNDDLKSNTIGKAKDAIDNLKTNRSDDFGYSVIYENAAGEKKYSLRRHYRDGNGTFRNQDQSLDLIGIMRLDFKASNAFKIRRQHENKLNMLIDTVKNKKFVNQKGQTPEVSSYTKKQRTKTGATSNTHAKMISVLESSYYDILNKNELKIFGADANKVVGYITGATSFLQLSLNIASATANVINGNAQIFLESFLKGQSINAASIAKANKLYSYHLADTLKDTTRPINTSYTNQLNELFDVSGLFNLSKSDFIKTNLAKQAFSFNTLQVFQQSGENWMQSVITMSILDGVKVMNSKNQFINKDGKVVKTKKEAASLLDMSIKNPETGIVSVSDKVAYTTHSKLTKFKEGGKSNIDMLLKKKLFDMLGNYSETDQPEIMKHWYGKLLMLYRKYLIPMGIARWRGFTSSNKDKNKLLDNEIFYSEALQQYEEGTYVTLIRFMFSSFRDKKYSLMLQNWDNLTDYEKHNIKKSVSELTITGALLPLIGAFLKAIADEEDDEVLFFLAYQIRRLDTELSSYRDFGEAFKMLRSPIPSLKLAEDSFEIVTRVFSPWNWDEEYEGGRRAGENKLKSKMLRTLPIFKEFQRTYEDLYNFQNR